MHAQRALSAQIVERGGDYLWVVKENQERLYQDIERLFTPDKPKPGFGKITTDFVQAETVNKAHGRIEKRCIQTSAMLNDYVDWPGLEQVYRLERSFTWVRQGKVLKTSKEVEYGITSLSRAKASPKRVLQIRRKHWLIETGLHYRRDVTFREDATRMTKGASEWIGVLKHALRNALIPITTILGLQVGMLLGGAVVTETIFSIPGLGRMIVEGIFERDFPVVQGAIIVIVLFILTVNIIVDLPYPYLDKRVKL